MYKLLLAAILITVNFQTAAQLLKVKSEEGVYHIVSAHKDTVVSIAGEKKFALIIGNTTYRVSPLQNAVNDANDLAALIEKKNFTVIKVINGTRLEMRDAVRDFANRIKEGGVGLFYYSGHGLQVEGENYLVPVDADFHAKEEVQDQCIRVSSVLRFMETSKNRLNIMILDACRNSPFKSFGRSTDKGIAGVDAPTGSIVAYSTAPGKIASDGKDRNGLYTSKLLKYLNVPGMKIEDVFKQVRIEVSKESNNEQSPWESNSLMGDFYFTE